MMGPITQVIVNLRALTPTREGGGESRTASRGLLEQMKMQTNASTQSSALGGVLGSTLGGDCRCTAAPVAELTVRRYPATREDLISKERRYEAVRSTEFG